MILRRPRDSSSGSTKVATASLSGCSPLCHMFQFETTVEVLSNTAATTTRLQRRHEDEDDVVLNRKFMTSHSRAVRSNLFVSSLPSFSSFVTLIMLSIVILSQSPQAFASLATQHSQHSSSTITYSALTSTMRATVTSTSAASSVGHKTKGNVLNYLKAQKPISIPENRVVTTEDTEDYLEEDSAEFDYEELLKKENASGNGNGNELFIWSQEEYSLILNLHDNFLGLLVGSRCEFTCDKRLHHVYCNPNTDRCECDKKYPVKIGQWMKMRRMMMMI